MNNQINIFLMIQIISVINALTLGWNVKKTGQNRYELTIKKSECHAWRINDLGKIVDDLVTYNFKFV